MNWSPAAVPTSGQNVCITVDGTYTVILSVNSSINSLTLGTTSGANTQTLQQNGSFTLTSASTIEADGVLDWRSSQINGPGTLTNARLIATSASNKNLNTTLVNDGTIEHSEALLSILSAGTLTNNSLFDILDAADIGNVGVSTNASTGTLRKSAGGGGSSAISVSTVINAGTIDAQSGVLAFTSSLDHQVGGLITGNATVQVPAPGPLTNAGITGPGPGTELLTWNGDFPMEPTAAFDVEIGGPTAGTDHDQLQVSNSATLAGDLTVSLTGGFIPAHGDQFTVLTASSVSGTFANPNANDRIYAGNGVAFTVIYNAASVVLEADLLEADYAIAKSVSPTSVNVGDPATFTVTITNIPGSDDLTEFGADAAIEVEDVLPSGLTLNSSSASAGTFNGTLWTLSSLPDGNAATLTLDVIPNSAGTFDNTATLIGSNLPDGNAANNSFTATLTATSPNTPPTADAGPDQTVTDADNSGSEPVTLDGSGSTDPDGSIASYVWTNQLGTQIATGETPVFSFAVGVTTVTLTVTDNDGATATDEVIITVNAPANQNPTADAGPDQTVIDTDGSGDEQVTLDGSGSSDPDGTIATYSWTLGGAEIATGATPQVTLPVGTSAVVVTVTDDDGATATDEVVITVTAQPTVDLAITKATDVPSVTVGETVVFTLTVTNVGGTAATGVSVTEMPDPALSFVGASGDGSYSGTTWTIGNLDAAENATTDLTFRVTEAGTFSNMATVSSTEEDSDATDNTASDDVTGVAVTCAITDLDDSINQSARQLELVFTNSDGIRYVRFRDDSGNSALNNFTVFSATANEGGVQNETGGTPGIDYEAQNPSALPTEVTFVLQGGAGASSSYFAIVSSFCPTEADGLLEMDFDPPVTLDAIPEAFVLEGGYPNPFNPSTTIVFAMPEAGDVHLAIYDLLGRHVTTLVDGPMEAGRHDVRWEATAGLTGTVSGGVYLIRMQTGGVTQTKTVTLLK